MGGGMATAELAGAVSRAGALGTVGILPPAHLGRSSPGRGSSPRDVRSR
jgi:hypothetical protein